MIWSGRSFVDANSSALIADRTCQGCTNTKAPHDSSKQCPSASRAARFKFQTKIQVRVSSCNFQVSSFKPRSRSGFQVAISKFQVSNQDPGQGFKLQFPSFKFQTKIQVRASSCNFQVSSFKPRSRSGFQDAISKFQDSHQDPGQGFKMQFPSFKIHTKIQVRVSRCNFQVSRFTPRSRSGFQGAISKFQDSHQDPGQGFKLQFPSFKIHTKIQVRVSSCNFQVSRFKPRSRSGFQVAISKFQDSHQDPGQGFKVQFPSFKIHTKIQVRVSRCNFQVSRFTPRSRSGFQGAISKFQDSHQDPGQGFKMQFPSFKIHTKIQVRVSRCNFQVSRFTPRSRSGFQVAISKFQDSHQDPGQGFKMQFPSFKIHTKIQVRVSRCNFQVSRFTPRSRSGFQDAISKFQDSNQDPGQGFKLQFPSFKIHTKIQGGYFKRGPRAGPTSGMRDREARILDCQVVHVAGCLMEPPARRRLGTDLRHQKRSNFQFVGRRSTKFRISLLPALVSGCKSEDSINTKLSPVSKLWGICKCPLMPPCTRSTRKHLARFPGHSGASSLFVVWALSMLRNFIWCGFCRSWPLDALQHLFLRWP